jgi:hypothetical protein
MPLTHISHTILMTLGLTDADATTVLAEVA